MKLKKDDVVFIRTGDDRGKTGKITKILRKKNLAIVDGINKKFRHIKKRDGRPGEKVEFFAPLHISNLAFFDAKKKAPSRIGIKIDGKNKQRISKKSGEILVAKKIAKQ